MAALDGVDLKLARARHHLADLTDQVNRAIATSGFALSSTIEGTPRAWVYRVVGVPVISSEWTAIVGDILTNLRAALDHLAWQLVLLDGQVPGRETSFPLVDTPTTRNGQPRAVVKPDGWRQGDPGLQRADLRAAVESVQAYGHENALWQLNQMCNIDKHRELLVVNLFPDIGDVWWGSNEGDPPATPTFNSKRPLTDGDWLVRFDFAGEEPASTFEPHVGPILVVLDEGPLALRTTAIQKTMSVMVTLVEQSIVNWQFRRFFS